MAPTSWTDRKNRFCCWVPFSLKKKSKMAERTLQGRLCVQEQTCDQQHAVWNTLHNTEATSTVLGPYYSEFKVYQQDSNNMSSIRLNFSYLVSALRQSSQSALQRQRITLSLQMGKLRHSATKWLLRSTDPDSQDICLLLLLPRWNPPSPGHGRVPFPPPSHTLSHLECRA